MRTDWFRILVLWAVGLGAAAQFAKVSVAYPQMREIYAGSGATVGFTVSLVGLVGIVFGVSAGLIIARAGYRRSVLGALGLGVLCSAVQATFPPLSIFLATRVIEGISHLFIVVAVPTLMVMVATPSVHRQVMTLWGSFFGVGFALTFWVGHWVIEAYGPAALYLAHSAYLALFAVILWSMLPSVSAPEQSERLQFGNWIREHIEIYTSPSVSAPAFGFLCHTMLYVALLTYLPEFVSDVWRPVLGPAMPLASILVSLTLGMWLVRWIAPAVVVQVGFAAFIAATFAAWNVLGQDQSFVIAVLVMMSIGGIVQGASFAAIPDLNPDYDAQVRANGAMAQLGNVGSTFGTPILAVALAASGFGGLVLFVTFFALLGIFAHSWLRRRRAREVFL